MKKILKKFLKACKRNSECVLYIALNLFVLFAVLIIRLIPEASPFFDAVKFDDSTSNTVVTVIITIVTLIAALESLVNQIYFNRSTKRYFSKTSKSIASIVIFGIFGILFSLKINNEATSYFLVVVLAAVVIFVVFFIYDLLAIDVSYFIDKQIKSIIKCIENCNEKSLGEIENRLITVYKDSLLNGDTYFAERVIGKAPTIVETILDNKYKNDKNAEQNSPIRKSLDFVYSLVTMCLLYCKDDAKEYFLKRLIISMSSIIKALKKYDNQTLFNDAIEVVLKIINDSNQPEEIADFFAAFNISSPKNKKAETKEIMKEIKLCYEVYNPKYINYRLNVTTDFIARIGKLFDEDILTNIDGEFYELLKSIASDYLSLKKPNEYVCASYLFCIWKAISDKECLEDFKKFIGLKNKESSFTINSKNCLIIDVLIHRIVKEVSDSDLIDYYSICLDNLSISIYYFKEEQYSKPLPFNEDCLNKCFDSYVEAYIELSKHANPNVVMTYFDALNDFGLSLEKKDKDVQKKILQIYSKTLVSLANIESLNRIVDVDRYYLKFIYDLDKNDKISESLSKEITKLFFATVSSLINCQSPHSHLVFEDVHDFGGYDCKLNFIRDKKPTKYMELCAEVRDIGTLGREYHNNEIIKVASSFIGWSLYRLLQDRTETYQQVYNNSAYQFFKILIELNSDDDIIDFVGTLFVINFAYCFSLSSGDSRYKFASTRFNNLTDSMLEHIKKSILLRKYAKEWLDFPENDFDRGIKELERRINDQLR